MKIKLTSTTGAKADTVEYKDGIFNGVNLSKLEYIERTEENPQDVAIPYVDAEGIIHIHLNCDIERQFLFVNNNYLKFHDKDLNGVLDEEEFTEFVRVWNLSEDERRKYHAKVLGK